MFPKLISNSYSLKIFLFLSIFLFSYGQAPQCILGKNCPINQGTCAAPNYCKCNEGYETLIDETLMPGQQIYCNYEQMSQYTPIILEIFLPSMGHFVVGNYIVGIIKFLIIISYILSSFSLYDEFRFPPLMKYLYDKLEIESLLKIERKEDEDEGKGDDEKGEEKADDNNQENKPLRARNTKDRKVSSEENDVEKENDDDDEDDGCKIGYQAYDEEEETPEQEEELISKDDKKNEKEDARKKRDAKKEKEHKFIKFIFDVTGIVGSLLYFMDLFLYKFKIYTDGNGIAFV